MVHRGFPPAGTLVGEGWLSICCSSVLNSEGKNLIYIYPDSVDECHRWEKGHRGGIVASYLN